jgi:hypothetical protein
MAFITVIVKQDKEQLKRIEDKLDQLLSIDGNVKEIEKAIADLKQGRTDLKKAVDKNTPK